MVTGGLLLCSRKPGSKPQVEAATCGTGVQKERPASFVQVGPGEAFPGSAGEEGLVVASGNSSVGTHDTSEEGGGHCSCPSWGGPLFSLRPWGVCVRFNDSYLETRLLLEGY